MQVQIFALMGSAAFVGGISQMVLSMTMIMVEVIGDIFLLIPFATALITSHWVRHGLLDIALYSPYYYRLYPIIITTATYKMNNPHGQGIATLPIIAN